MVKKTILAVVACLFISGCLEEVKVIEINSTSTTRTIDESELFDLEISGINNTITIMESNKVRNIDMSGLTNSVIVKDNTTIESFYLGGTDHTVTIPKSSEITFSGRPDLHEIIEL